MKNSETLVSLGDPQQRPTSAARRGVEVQKVLALGRPGARPPGGVAPPVEPHQLVALAGAHAPEEHLPQEPPSDPPRCHPRFLCHCVPRSRGVIPWFYKAQNLSLHTCAQDV
jgi:hypothetical protein